MFRFVITIHLLFVFFINRHDVFCRVPYDTSNTIIISFAGDIMGHMPQIKAAYDSASDKYDFTECFQYIKPYIKSAHISIVNLETTLAGNPYSGYPLFSSPDELAIAASKAGFDIFATANNHCYDKGKAGFERTIKILDSLKIKRIGTYRNINERNKMYPLIIDTLGIRIALFNYTYGTNGIQPESPNLVNYINREQITRDVRKADSMKVDLKIIFLHWGKEYITKPDSEQINLTRFLISLGFDAIIGSHPHVVQTFELINDTNRNKKVPVFYSLGNFISNQRDFPRDGGAIFYLIIQKNFLNNTLSIYPKQQKHLITSYYKPFWVHKGYLNNKFQFYVLPLPDFIEQSKKYNLPSHVQERMQEYYDMIQKQLFNLPSFSTQDSTLILQTR